MKNQLPTFKTALTDQTVNPGDSLVYTLPEIENLDGDEITVKMRSSTMGGFISLDSEGTSPSVTYSIRINNQAS